jgi:Dynamin central region
VQGRGGGERVLQVFEEQLPQALNAQPFAQLLSIQSVKRIIQDSDGYQPFLVAPENGYRALIKEGVKLMEQPAAAAVDAVDMVLRDIGQKVRQFVRGGRSLAAHTWSMRGFACATGEGCMHCLGMLVEQF